MPSCTCRLLTRSAVCQILSFSEPTLRHITEYGLLSPPDCAHGLMWHRATVLQFTLRRQSDPIFDAAVRELSGW